MNLNRNEGGRMQRSRPSRIATIVIAAAIFALTSAFGGNARAASSDTVVATVGSHRITQQEMDAKMLQSISPTQLYDLRKNALDSLINDYLLEQAATHAHLTPDQYLKSQIRSKKMTEADARKFFNDKIGRFGTTTFDQIKQRLIPALQQREDRSEE